MKHSKFRREDLRWQVPTTDDFQMMLPLWRGYIKLALSTSPLVRNSNIHLFDESLKLELVHNSFRTICIDETNKKGVAFIFKPSVAKAKILDESTKLYYQSCLAPEDFEYWNAFQHFLEMLYSGLPLHVKLMDTNSVLDSGAIYIDPNYRHQRIREVISKHCFGMARHAGVVQNLAFSTQKLMQIIFKKEGYTPVTSLPIRDFSHYHRIPNPEFYAENVELYTFKVNTYAQYLHDRSKM